MAFNWHRMTMVITGKSDYVIWPESATRRQTKLGMSGREISVDLAWERMLWDRWPVVCSQARQVTWLSEDEAQLITWLGIPTSRCIGNGLRA